jgi:N6-L-threonylcarbamoyladenine synthase
MLEHIANTYDPTSPVHLPSFPIPVPGVLSFSYGGLLSAVQRYIEQVGVEATNEGPVRAAIAYAFQHAAVRQVEKKISLALRICEKQGIQVRTLVASGGVASNRYLRSR